MSPLTMPVVYRGAVVSMVLAVVPWAGLSPVQAQSSPISSPTNIEATGTHELAFIGEWGTGQYSDIYVEGSYAYAAAHMAGLDVVDISDPTNPEIVATAPTASAAVGVHVSNSLAFVVSDWQTVSYLEIFDLSDPLAPSLVGDYEPAAPYHYTGIFVSGDYAYVSYTGGGIDVLDVSDPTTPSLIGAFRGSSPPGDIFVTGNRAYLAASDHMYILDVSDPTSPSLLGIWNGSPVTQIYVIGDYAYLAARNWGLVIVDVSDPTSPAQAGREDGACSVYCYTISGSSDYAYLSGSGEGLNVVDVSNPTLPQRVGGYGNEYYETVFSVGASVYLANYRKFEIADASVPATPAAVGGYRLTYQAWDVDVAGDLAYFATYNGLAILDISDPYDPSLLTWYPPIANVTTVDVEGTYAYLGFYGSTNAFQILDVSDPSTPSFVGSYSGASWASDLYIQGDYAYFTRSAGPSSDGLLIIDVSNPSLPWLAGSWGRDASGSLIEVRGEHAYLSIGYGSRILDIDPPWNVTPVSDLAGRWYLDLEGDYVYLCDYNAQAFRIFDVTDPTAPVLESSTPLGCHVTPIAAADGYAYIDAYETYQFPWERSLYVFDVSDPTAPDQVGAYPKRGDGRNMKIVEDFLYLADGYTGKLLIYRVVSADLSLTKIDSVDPVTPGTELSYTLTVTNNGWAEATEVVLTDTLPGAVSFLSSVPGAPACTETSGVVTCNLGTLAVGASSEVIVHTRVSTSASGTLNNSATALATQLDWDPANNVAAELTTVGPPICDLAVRKTDSADPVIPGDPFTYTVSAGNYGPSLAGSVTLTDPLPEDVVFVSVDPGAPTCTESGGTVTCNLGPLDARSAKDVTIDVVTNADFMGSVTNIASVTGPDLDPVLGNNEAEERTRSVVVFSDGFESGDISAWSETEP